MPKDPNVAVKVAAAPPTRPNRVELPADDSWFAPLDETEDYVNLLYYGKEGTTKTTNLAFAANAAPEGSRVLVINAEGGLKLIPLRRRGVDTSKIAVYPPKPGDKVTRAGLDGIFRRVRADLDKDPNSWYAVAFDSITEITVAMVEEAQGKRIESARRKGLTPDEDFVDRDDYGVMTKVLRDILRKFRDLECHFIVTALERRDVDADTSKPMYGPAVTPALATDLLGYVDMVLMCKNEDEDGPARALTRANSRYRAKDRFDVLPKVLAVPTFDRVIGYLDDLIHQDDDPLQLELPSRAKKSQDAPASPPDTDDEDTQEEENE